MGSRDYYILVAVQSPARKYSPLSDTAPPPFASGNSLLAKLFPYAELVQDRDAMWMQCDWAGGLRRYDVLGALEEDEGDVFL